MLSVQAERPLRPSGPLLIRGFGVRAPGGAPVKSQVKATLGDDFGTAWIGRAATAQPGGPPAVRRATRRALGGPPAITVTTMTGGQ